MLEKLDQQVQKNEYRPLSYKWIIINSRLAKDIIVIINFNKIHKISIKLISLTKNYLSDLNLKRYLLHMSLIWSHGNKWKKK